MMQKHFQCPIKEDGSVNLLCCNTGWLVCMVGSRFTHAAEVNYSATEGELLAQTDALHKTKYFTLGCQKLILGTDHMPLLGLMANRNLDSIDNLRLVRLKQKTLGWKVHGRLHPWQEIGRHRSPIQVRGPLLPNRRSSLYHREPTPVWLHSRVPREYLFSEWLSLRR